jgi:hypothetical protein
MHTHEDMYAENGIDTFCVRLDKDQFSSYSYVQEKRPDKTYRRVNNVKKNKLDIKCSFVYRYIYIYMCFRIHRVKSHRFRFEGYCIVFIERFTHEKKRTECSHRHHPTISSVFYTTTTTHTHTCPTRANEDKLVVVETALNNR